TYRPWRPTQDEPADFPPSYRLARSLPGRATARSPRRCRVCGRSPASLRHPDETSSGPGGARSLRTLTITGTERRYVAWTAWTAWTEGRKGPHGSDRGAWRDRDNGGEGCHRGYGRPGG